MEPLQLHVTNMGFSFTHLPLFRNISFAVNSGEVLQLTGSNGAGKSTFMSILAGFRKQTTGEIELISGTEEVAFEQEREYLAAESNSLYYDMDAMSNLLFWQKLRSKEALGEAKLVQTLKYWGLGRRLVYKDFAVGNFSTGMKRRLALARVQCSTSRIWLLDEPLYGLDVKGVALFKELILTHKQNGGVCIMISHDTRGFDSLIDKKIAIAA